MNIIPLAYGVYETTDVFRAIPQHSCVCNAETLDLVAVTGPAYNEESREFAQLFAASIQMFESLTMLVDAVKRAHVDGEGYQMDCPICRALRQAESSIDKAKGVQ